MSTSSKYWRQGPIDPQEAAELIREVGKHPHVGGQDIFLGQIRADQVNESTVLGIEYSSFDSMAEEAFEKIEKQVFGQFEDIVSITILHSLGLVKVGELSLVVFVASKHRDTAFKACREIVELIKAEVPIWKKELLEAGHSWVGDPGRL